MKKVCKFLGTFCLSIAALVVVMGPASVSFTAVEELPESIRNKR